MADFYPVTPIPFQLVNPDTGALASGFVLEAYLAGTTTPTAMYVDSIGTPAGVTITMNSAGYPTVSGSVVNIYLSKTIDYKFILKDAASGTEWTVDNVPALVSTEVTYLDVASMKDSNILAGTTVKTDSYYAFNGTTKAQGGGQYQILSNAEYIALTGGGPDGYIDHTLDNGNVAMLVHNNVINPHQAGARGDGSDQTLNIQAIINKMTSTSGGLVIEFLNGDYVVSSLTVTSKFGLTLQGEANSVFSVVQVKGAINCTNCGDFRVRDLKFVSNAMDLSDRSLTTPTTDNNLFNLLDNCAHWDITGCDFVGFDRVFMPSPSASSTGAYVINIHDNYFQSNNYDVEGGLVLHWNMYANTYAETRISNMRLSRAAEVHYTNNCHENGINTMTGHNVELYNASGQGCNSIIKDNTFHEFAGFRFNNVLGVILEGNTTRIHNATDLDAILIDGASQNITLGVNEFNGFQGGSDFAARAVYVTGTAANVQISSGFRAYNYITGLLSDSGQFMKINDADIRGNTTGIWIQNQSVANRVIVTDCVIQGGTNALQSTGNAARWSERGSTFLGGAITNTDGFLDQFYAAGSWTPSLWDNSNSDAEGQTYGTRVGTYTKIGNKVFCQGRMAVTSIGTLSTGQQARIGGLPFTASASAATGGITFSGAGGINTTEILTGEVSASSNFATISDWSGANGTAATTVLNIGSSSEISFNIQYEV